MTPLRVGLIGARRARQGLGPFLARDLRAAGAEVPCFQVTTETSVAEAERQLREIAGVEARGYTDLSALLAGETLDALVISSPHESHADALAAAAEADLHVLCEKPLVWGEGDLAVRAAACVAAFEKRGLELWENCQWPYTLAAFERLHPGSTGAPPQHFSMKLRPAGTGAKMLADSLPHPLSLLQRLAPGPEPRIDEVAFSTTAPDAAHIRVHFRYCSGASETACEVELRPTQAHPREVALTIDGRQAVRRTTRPEYRLSYEDGERSVPLDDPMSLLVTDFVTAVTRAGSEAAPVDKSAAHVRHRLIVERMALLGQARTAWERALARTHS